MQSQIEANVEAQSGDSESPFSSIRLYFREIVEEVTSHKAPLSVYVNRDGHLELKAEVLNQAGKATSADLGHTYRKLLCIAFDIRVITAGLAAKLPVSEDCLYRLRVQATPVRASAPYHGLPVPGEIR